MDFAIKDIQIGKLNALVKNLMSQMETTSPAEAIRRINAKEWVVTQVKLPASPPWKSVTVGNLGNVLKHLKEAGIKIAESGFEILGRMDYEENELSLDLVLVSLEELGLTEYSTVNQIYTAAEHHGLSLCPAEVGPQLWLQHPDLLQWRESLHVAMEPILDSEHKRCVFTLWRNENGCLLGSDRCDSVSWWGKHRWVFVRSR